MVSLHWVGLQLSDDTMFDMIDSIFPLQKTLVEKQAILYTKEWQPRFRNHQQVRWR